MGRDRSLDEFFGGDGGGADDDTESDADTSAEPVDGATTDADGDEDASDDDAESHLPDASHADPVTPTYRWTPEGAACESCGSVVERRWVDDGAFVCDDCKEW